MPVEFAELDDCAAGVSAKQVTDASDSGMLPEVILDRKRLTAQRLKAEEQERAGRVKGQTIDQARRKRH
jgi:hypothetical protein